MNSIHDLRRRLTTGSGILLVPVFLLLLPVLDAQEYSGYSLEQLAEIPVVETGRASDRLFDVPASAFVFDQEALQYLPVDSVPEALRYAPGMHVMQSTNGVWGLAVRGMNSRYMGRTLFTVDEQNIYTTVFSGLFGSQHDLLIDDVASVEVVYGPSGALWSPNALNGMVSVILKPAFETEGGVLRVHGGPYQWGASARQGWAASDRTSARVFAKYGSHDPGREDWVNDAWTTRRVGFQVDSRLSGQNLLSFSGEAYSSRLGYTWEAGNRATGEIGVLEGTERQDGVTAQARWTHQVDRENGISIRGWTGYSEFESSYAVYDLGIVGTEVRIRYSPSERQQWIFSGSGVLEDKEFRDSNFGTIAPDYETFGQTLHAGIEYTYDIVPDVLEASAGLGFMYDSEPTAAEFLPSLRLLYRPTDAVRLWVAHTRAAHTVPDGLYNFQQFHFGVNKISPTPLPLGKNVMMVDRFFFTGYYDQNVEPETLDALEAGYRHQLGDDTSLRVSVFHNRYKNLIGGYVKSIAPMINVPNPYLGAIFQFGNMADAETSGVELSVQKAFHELLDLTVSYSYQTNDFTYHPQEQDPIVVAALKANPDFRNGAALVQANPAPRHLASLLVASQWTSRLRTDIGVRYTGELFGEGGIEDAIWQADARATWQVTDDLRLSLVGRNLLHSYTYEGFMHDMDTESSEQPREWYLELRYQF